MIQNLTTLIAAREWCGVPVNTTTDDGLLARLIPAASRLVYGFLGRPSLLSRTLTERYNGPGGTRLMLREWPVTAVSAVTVDNVAIAAAANPGLGLPAPNGFLLEPWDGTPPGRPQSIDLFGWGFARGRQNVSVTRTAGYLVAAEPQTIPGDPYALKVDAPFGPWAADGGVAFVGGTALALVTGTPVAGQYALPADLSGTYQFAAADTGKAVLLSYSFIPADVFQAATELVGERYAYKGRIGHVSKSLGGQETMSYSLKDMPDAMKLMLQPYRNVIPF